MSGHRRTSEMERALERRTRRVAGVGRLAELGGPERPVVFAPFKMVVSMGLRRQCRDFQHLRSDRLG